MNGDNCSRQNESKQNPSLTMAATVANKDLGRARPPGRAAIGLQHDTRAIGPKTVTQHRNRFWTPTSTDDSCRLRMHLSRNQSHWKRLEIIFPSISSAPKSDSVCNLGVRFSVGCSWSPKLKRSRIGLGLHIDPDVLAGPPHLQGLLHAHAGPLLCSKVQLSH